MGSSWMVSICYFLFSMIELCALYCLARHFSGSNFGWIWFCICFVLVIFFGSFHMSTARYGYDILFPALAPILKGNDAVGWIAFISVFLHACCVPTQYEPRRWYSRK